MRASILSVLILSCCAVGVLAQTDTATITGVVSDASEAAVPGASLSVVNTATGLKYEAESNGAGVYEIPALPIGEYRVTVKHSGFQTLERRGVTLHAGDRARIDLRLQVGAVTQVAEVTSAAPLLQVETSNLSQAVENATITNMPLNGRDYQQLALLSPGVMPQRLTNVVTDGFSVNGAAMWQNQFVMDGMDNNNYLFGVTTATNQAIKPSVDAIQEFVIQTHNFSAEFGRGGGAVIEVTTKSGTNQFHGTGFEFLRNDKIQANDFFANLAGQKRPAFRQNQFGGTFGGPVRKDKTFFFGSYQGTRIRQLIPSLQVVPTLAQLSGNFGSTAVYDPATQNAAGARQPFPGNSIPSSRIDPVGIQELRLYPTPDVNGVQNYLYNGAQPDRDDQIDTRADHRFKDSDTISLRYSYHNRNRIEPGALPIPADSAGATRKVWTHTGVVSYTHVFSGASLVNEARLAYSRNHGLIGIPDDMPLWKQFGFQGLVGYPGMTGLPFFTISGFASMGDRSQAPDPKAVDIKQATDGLSWQKGRHSMKFGTDIRNFRRFAGTTNWTRGQFNFTGQFTSAVGGTGTGPAIADALLGLTASAESSTSLNDTLLSSAVEFYGQDDFKVNRKLTLNLGLRYEYQQPWTEWHNRFSNFVFQQGLPGYGTIVLAPSSGSQEQRAFQQNSPYDFAPRLGLAYQLTSSTVLRAGFGMFYYGSSQTYPANTPMTNPPFYLQATDTTTTSASTSDVIVKNGFPPNFLQPNVLTGLTVFNAWPYSYPDPVTSQWNVNLEQSLPGSFVASLAYVGSNSVHRPNIGGTATVDLNQPVPGSTALNSRRAFPNLSGILLNAPLGSANYEALEVKVERRFKSGLSSLNGYTWSHGEMIQIGEDTRILQREKSLNSEDMRQRLFSTIVWELPFGGGKRWATTGPASHVLGGWQVSTLFTAQTGMLFTPTMTVNAANSTAINRPNRIGSGVLSGARGWQGWFDKTAFQIPALYTFGNAGAYILQGPGIVNLDASASRTFRLNERFRLEFRAEFFNALNHVNFSLPNASINTAPGGTISSLAVPARQIQFAMKLRF